MKNVVALVIYRCMVVFIETEEAPMKRDIFDWVAVTVAPVLFLAGMLFIWVVS